MYYLLQLFPLTPNELSRVTVLTLIAILAILLRGENHETLQIVWEKKPPTLLSDRCFDSQEERRESDARRHPPVNRALLQTPTGVAVCIPDAER